MLRVGLTGGLGSGKSTIAGFFRELGAHVIEADAVGRALMQPGEAVFNSIVTAFGESVVREDGSLDRKRLAALAFDGGRLGELDRIVHPPVIAAQEAWMEALFAREPEAVAIVESALIFEAGRSAEEGGTVPGWRKRFDRIVLVAAPDEFKIARFVERMGGGLPLTESEREALAEDARRRLRAQVPDEEKLSRCDYVIQNDASLLVAREQSAEIFADLQKLSRAAALNMRERRGGA